MNTSVKTLVISLSLFFALLHSIAYAAASSDVLTPAAQHSPLAQQHLLLDSTRAGSRLIAVGQFGHILYSDDEGQSWTQAQVPVSSTLTAIYFTGAQYGWAVGHDGVVLASTDGGVHWHQQLNGLQINQLILNHVQRLSDFANNNDGNLPNTVHPALTLEDLETLQMDAEDFHAEGASRPLMDIWFKNKNEGWIVGAFGILLHTSDGGKSWQASFDKTENFENFHYYSILPTPSTDYPNALLLIGESGLLQRSLDGGQSWQSLFAPYEGSFFGGLYLSDSQQLLIFGLRGKLFRSADLGDSWQAVDSQTTASLFAADQLSDGSILLVGSAGLQLTVDSTSFVTTTHFSPKRAPYSGLTSLASGQAMAVGLAGIELIPGKRKQ